MEYTWLLLLVAVKYLPADPVSDSLMTATVYATIQK